MAMSPFCSSEHGAGSSAWSIVIASRNPASPATWLAASYVSRTSTPVRYQRMAYTFPPSGTNGGSSKSHLWLMPCPLPTAMSSKTMSKALTTQATATLSVRLPPYHLDRTCAACHLTIETETVLLILHLHLHLLPMQDSSPISALRGLVPHCITRRQMLPKYESPNIGFAVS
ncbi:hypothetical protein A1F97_03415 [Pyrenophora tritici-repentis]|nr:hypothetical protein L13192_07852 [Pyrenophora tritici-repentis]PZD31412.1 hypothetical protein A1F96_03625 [Pyrenophora tritici-repentis]PZD42658.1 hypothetical protein A1F97_03415 [Pyrenophora tritici-repentis]